MQPASHIRLVVHPARRSAGHTDWPGSAELPVPPLDDVIAAAEAHRPAGIVWLGGGEPTLRADLPRLISELSARGFAVGLDTDGLALVKPAVLAGLKERGLAWLRLPLHSVIAAAHDWVEGQPGGAKRVRRTAAAAREVGLSLAFQALVTRSTVPHLVDTVRAAHALGASIMHLRRPRRRGRAGDVFVTVSPRLGLAEPYLEAASARGRDAGLAVRLDGFPRCVCTRVRSDVLTEDREQWVIPDALMEALAPLLTEPAPAPSCPRCPGLPTCTGAPADYVDRFGRLEIDDPGLSATERPRPLPPVYGETPAVPPPRAGRSPATRLRFAVRQSSLPDLGGDPTAGMDHNPVQPLRMTLSGTSRNIRIEMVRLSQSGPAPLQIDAGADLARPDAHALLREVLRLGFTHITVRGDVTALGKRSRRSLTRLKGIHRFEAGLWHPDASQHDALAGEGHHAGTLAALAHLAATTDAEIGVVAWLPERPTDSGLAPWAAAQTLGALPGELRFEFPSEPNRPAWTAVLDNTAEPLATALRLALESRAVPQ
jgi:MoaA/NifB/PqqE/SkfB family radical SAM enzyme